MSLVQGYLFDNLLCCSLVMGNSHNQLSYFSCGAWKDSVSFVVLYLTEKSSVYV